MEGGSLTRKNEKFQKLRGKIKISLPSLSPDRRKAVSLSSSPQKEAEDGVLSPKILNFTQPEAAEAFTSAQPFCLKNVFEEKYEILQKLGEGANGIVRKCRNRETGEVLAVKIGRMEQEHVIALKAIVEMMRKVKHPNILAMRELYVDTKRSKYYQVIDYLPHPSLKHLISHGYKFISSNIEKIMKQLLDALQYFHARHIVHRDIKTSNLLFDTATQTLYIIDLGLITKTVRRGKRRNLWTNTGTLEYKAPETLEGSTYNQGVDVWAAGVVLYELIERKTPFKEETQMDIIENIRNIKYKFSPELWVDIPLAKLLVTRLLKHKQQRLTATSALKDPWFQLMNFDYKPPKPQSPVKKPEINLTAFPYTNGGFSQSGAPKSNLPKEEQDQFVIGLCEQSKEFMRVTSYQTGLKKNPSRNSISAEDLDVILGKASEKDIINNNN